jgi:CO/xanthine dehydrogenase FAD-binding subunit
MRAAIDAAMSGARPLPGNAYKIPLARNAALRALELAAEQGGRR